MNYAFEVLFAGGTGLYPPLYRARVLSPNDWVDVFMYHGLLSNMSQLFIFCAPSFLFFLSRSDIVSFSTTFTTVHLINVILRHFLTLHS